METPQIGYGAPAGMMPAASPMDSMAKLSMVTGIMTAVGYLFWLFLAIVKRGDMPVGPIISIAVIGMLGGAAVITCAFVLKGSLRAYLIAGMGLLLQIFILIFAAKIGDRAGASCGLDYVVGGQTLSALGLVLLLLALAALHARQNDTASPLIRYTLGGLAGATLMLYLVQLLVFVAGDESDALPIAAAFSDGAAARIAYAVLLTIGLLGVLGISIGAAITTREVDQVAMAGLIVARIVLGLIVVFPLYIFMVRAIDGDDVKSMIVPLIGGIAALAPLVAAFYVLVAGVSESLCAVAQWLGSQSRIALEPIPALAQSGAYAAAPLPAQPADASGGIEDQLRKLKNWREQGLITEEEYQQKRGELLKKL